MGESEGKISACIESVARFLQIDDLAFFVFHDGSD